MRRVVVLKVYDLVCTADFVFNVQLAAVFPDRLDRLRLDVVIAARHAKDVPGDALAGYVFDLKELRVIDAMNQTRVPVVFCGLEQGGGPGCTQHNASMACLRL